MRRGQPEKAGKTKRLNLRVDRLQRAPVDFGADVDAKGGLQQRHRARGPVLGAGERLRQIALRRALARLLQDRIDDLRVGRLDRRCMGGDCLGPGRADLRLILGEQRFFPQQPDREKIGDGRVSAARQLGLPALEAGVLRPAAQRDQQPVETGVERGRGQPQPVGCPRNRVGGMFRRISDKAGKAAQTDDFGRQIMRCHCPPRFIGAVLARRRP